MSKNPFEYFTAFGREKGKTKTLIFEMYPYSIDDSSKYCDTRFMMENEFSRVVATILNPFPVSPKNKSLVANIPFDAIPTIEMRTKFANQMVFLGVKDTNKPVETPSKEKTSDFADSPAFSVPLSMYTPAKGKTPAQILSAVADKPKEEQDKTIESLKSHISYLEKGASTYRRNQVMIDAIKAALELWEIGELNASAADATATTIAPQSYTIYSSDYKFSRVKDDKGRRRCYSINIEFIPTMKSPFKLEIKNYWAPVTERPGGLAMIDAENAVDSESSAMYFSCEDWNNCVNRTVSLLNAFRISEFPKCFDYATELAMQNRMGGVAAD